MIDCTEQSCLMMVMGPITMYDKELNRIANFYQCWPRCVDPSRTTMHLSLCQEKTFSCFVATTYLGSHTISSTSSVIVVMPRLYT